MLAAQAAVEQIRRDVIGEAVLVERDLGGLGGGRPQGVADGEPESAGAVLMALEAALDRAGDVALLCCSNDELRLLLSGLERVRGRVDSLFGSVVQAARVKEVPASVGQGSVGAMLDAAVGCDQQVVGRYQRRCAWLANYSIFREAHAAGDLSAQHVEVLKRKDNRRTRAALHEAQENLVTAAKTCTWAGFLAVVRYLEINADPDGEEPREQAERRGCSVRKRWDGSVTGSFELDPVTGDGVVNAIAAEVQRLFDLDAQSGVERTARQRRGDAVANLIEKGAQREDGSLSNPLVHAGVSEQVMEDIVTGEPPVLSTDDIDGRCELADGTPLHPHWAAGLLTRATVRRLVLSPEGEILDLGRTSRGFPAHLKRAMVAAARGKCAVRGCEVPVGWLEADHIRPWLHGGVTATANGQILCGAHNRRKGGSVESVSRPG